MTLKLFKVAEVCGLAQLQPYVLRSWEKEFPGIGVQKSADGQRLYRQSDIDRVLRIKQLVFGEGLTLAGASRRLEEMAPVVQATETAEAIEILGTDVRKRIGDVRDGLRSLLEMLNGGTQAIAPSALQNRPSVRAKKRGSTEAVPGHSKAEKRKRARA
jgi:DNA-binding transcriptional MerR regulator